MRKALLVCIIVMFAAGPAGAAWQKPKEIFRKGPDTWVRIIKAHKDLVPLSHPQKVSVEDMDRALASIRYFQPSAFSLGGKEGDTYSLFDETDRKLLSGPLAQGLSQAAPEECVEFSYTAFKGPQLLGSFLQSDGLLFFRDGRLQIAFRNIAAKTEPGQTLNTYDPTRGYRSMVKLIAGPGQTLKAPNWVQLDLAAVPAPVVTAPGGPVVAAPPKSAKQRLLELEELKKDGLITEEEYQKKRQQILDQL